MIDDASYPDELIDDASGSTFTVHDHSGTLIQGHTVNVYQALEVEQRLPCSPIPPVDLRTALDRYAPPPQLAAAREQLQRTGTLVLVAEPGSGARTTALHLLAGRGHAGVHELEPDGSASGQAERLLAEVGHAHLIELDAGADPGWHRFCREVLSRTDELRAAGSSFVVTTSTSTWWASPADAALPVLRLDRPSARDVALAHLRGFGAADRVRWLDEPTVRGHLASETRPRDAARLARLLLEAPDADTAVQEFEGWRDHLRAWFEGDAEAVGHDDVAERALLVAAAVLNGFQPVRVWEGAMSLLHQIDAAEEPAVPLAGPGLGGRIEALGARLEGSVVRLDWRRRSLDHAVLDYVWSDYPRLRRRLLAWMLTLPSNGPVRERLALVISELVAGQEDTTFLAELARASGTALRWLVADVLGRTGRDPQIGRAVRRRLYDWATAPGTPPALGAAVADACGSELGRRYPRNALTRLRHLARHPDALVTDAVVAALAQLAAEPGLRGQVLDEVADWLRSADARRRQTAGAAFLQLAATVDARGVPILLDVRPEVVAAGWRHVLGVTGGPGEAVRRAVAAWMDSGDAARAALAGAAAADSVVSTALLRAVRAWAEGAADGETRWARVTVMDALYERVVEEERRW